MRLSAAVCAVTTWLTLPLAGLAADPPTTPAPTDSLVREEFATDGTGMTLQSARGAFLEVDAAQAGERIRLAAKQLRDHAATLAEDSRDSLHEAARDLEKLAARVEERGIQSVREFDKRLARAYHTIAQHHVDHGRMAWQAREHRVAGRRLRAAADNLETALRFSGQRVGEATEETIRDSRRIAAKLVEGSGYAVDDVGRAFAGLGREVENLGAQMEPPAKRYPDRLVIPK
ncbi:MAG TPA: hypothetical protein VGN12_15660 [Pirellulales bacterium]|jgi:hypothetical protein